MLEPEIAKKCVAAMAGAGLLALAGIAASRLAFQTGFEGAIEPIAGSAALAGARPGEMRGGAKAGEAKTEKAPVAVATEGQAPGHDRERIALERRALQLEADNVRLRARLDDMLNWIVANVRGTYPLPENQMANLRLDPVDGEMGVSEDLIQLLRLDEEEIGRLDAAFEGSRATLMEMETENIQVDQPDENQVKLNIAPFPEEGRAVREDLIGELRSTLGAARFTRFLQVAERGMDEQFDYFGDVDRTLLFEAMDDEATGAAQLYVRDERVIPNREDPMRYDVVATERVVTALPEEYYPYWNWLPEAVTRFHRSN